MRYLLLAAALMFPGVASAQYLDGLPPAVSVSGSDLVPICQGGTTGHPGTCSTRAATITQFQTGIQITGITAGTGLTGGGTSGTVTLNLGNTAVTAGSYTAPTLTVNAQGQITAASSNTLGTITGVTAGTGLSGGGTSGGVTINLANVAANSLLGNTTGSSAAPGAITMPGTCFGGANALVYTPGTGFGCNTISGGSATSVTVGSTTIGSGASGDIFYDNGGVLGQLATTGTGSVVLDAAPSISDVTLTGTTVAPTATPGDASTQIATTAFVAASYASPPTAGYGSSTPEPVAATTISASGLISPTSTVGIKGTTTNDSTQAGSIGEYQSNSATGVSVSNGVTFNAATISLTAGDWQVSGCVYYATSPATASWASMYAGINTTSATLPAFPGSDLTGIVAPFFASSSKGELCSPPVRELLSTTTMVYLVGQAAYSGGAITANGYIRARRMR